MSAIAIEPQQPTFDEADLLDRLDGDTELLVDLAETFLSAYENQLHHLKQCFAGSDFVGLARQAHALKGGLLTLSAHAAAHAIALEGAAKEERYDASERYVRGLEEELPLLAMDLLATIARLKA